MEKRALIIDKAGFVGRVSGNRKLLNTIIDLFLNDAPKKIEVFSTALAAEDFEEMEMQAHTLKGSSAGVGAVTISELADELQRAANAADIAKAGVLLNELRETFREVERLFREPGFFDEHF